MRSKSLSMISATLLLAASGAYAGSPQYTNPRFAEITRLHTTLALLPFEVSIGPEGLSKNVTAEMVRKEVAMHRLAWNLARGLMVEAARAKTFPLFPVPGPGSVLLLRELVPVERDRRGELSARVGRHASRVAAPATEFAGGTGRLARDRTCVAHRGLYAAVCG